MFVVLALIQYPMSETSWSLLRHAGMSMFLLKFHEFSKSFFPIRICGVVRTCQTKPSWVNIFTRTCVKQLYLPSRNSLCSWRCRDTQLASSSNGVLRHFEILKKLTNVHVPLWIFWVLQNVPSTFFRTQSRVYFLVGVWLFVPFVADVRIRLDVSRHFVWRPWVIWLIWRCIRIELSSVLWDWNFLVPTFESSLSRICCCFLLFEWLLSIACFLLGVNVSVCFRLRALFGCAGALFCSTASCSDNKIVLGLCLLACDALLCCLLFCFCFSVFCCLEHWGAGGEEEDAAAISISAVVAFAAVVLQDEQWEEEEEEEEAAVAKVHSTGVRAKERSCSRATEIFPPHLTTTKGGQVTTHELWVSHCSLSDLPFVFAFNTRGPKHEFVQCTRPRPTAPR